MRKQVQVRGAPKKEKRTEAPSYKEKPEEAEMTDTMHDPKTPAEWQEAVNLAEVLLDLENCKSYGLLASERLPYALRARSEELLNRGKRLGFRPAAIVAAHFAAGPASE